MFALKLLEAKFDFINSVILYLFGVKWSKVYLFLLLNIQNTFKYATWKKNVTLDCNTMIVKIYLYGKPLGLNKQ